MGWIKRNLFFFIGGVLGVLLLGLAGFYDYRSWDYNNQKYTDLTAVYEQLKQNTVPGPGGTAVSPGNSQINNIEIANNQEKQLREWLKQTRDYFQPIAPIPNGANGGVTSEAFAAALHRAIDQLQHAAVAANVQLPPQYTFSFTAQADKVRFPPASLEPLSTQLGEIKTLSEILFSAHINALDGIQRRRVSDDDTAGPAADYIEGAPVTGELGTLTPYQITFRAFGQETAQVLAALAGSPHGFIVKNISIQLAGAAGAASTPGSGGIDITAPAPAPMPVATASGRGGLQTLLNEQLLHITMEVEVVNLTAKN